MPYLLTVAGLGLLFGGGEVLVRGAVGLARRFGLSPMLVGLTVVAFATSAPELAVSVKSALSGNSAIAIGNVVGSNIANVALILGGAALVLPIAMDRRDIRRDGYMMFGAFAALAAAALYGTITRWIGLVFVVVLVAYVWISYRIELKRNACDEDWHAEEAEEFEGAPNAWISAALVVGGVAMLVLGANWLVAGAEVIAKSFGVPDAVVGLTIVAFGTSLPEFATSIVASFRGHSEVAVGNVIGSNIFNVLSILGITALIAPVTIEQSIARVDIPVMFAVALLGIGPLIVKGKVPRWLGGVLVATYLAYVGTLYVTALR